MGRISCGLRRRPGALRVQAVQVPGFTVLEFDESTKTSADAAAAIGCTIAQIAKSINFRGLRERLENKIGIDYPWVMIRESHRV